MDNQFVTFGIVGVVSAAVVAVLVAWRWVTTYADSTASEALAHAAAADRATDLRIKELEAQMESLRLTVVALELKVVEHYATTEHVNLIAGRIENAMEKLLNRFDGFANTFSQAMVDLARRNGGSEPRQRR